MTTTTKKQQYNFYISYWESYKLLNTDKEKVEFINIINQIHFFEIHIDRVEIKSQNVKLLFASIKHSLKTSIQGYCDKMGLDYDELLKNNNSNDPCQPPCQPPCQEIIKNKEEVIKKKEQYNFTEIAEDIYFLYALKKGKKTGLEKLITYLQKSKDVEVEIKKIKNHIENYNQACKKDNYKFMKHFDSYINQQPWNDEVVVETKEENKMDLNICIEDIKKGTARFELQNLSIWYSRGFAKLTQEQVKIIQGGINGK